MKVLKVILIIIAILFAGILIWDATLPSQAELKRSIDIKASPKQVYSIITDFKTWPDWSAWFKMDTAATVEWGDTTVGVGASYKWNGPVMETGEQKIIAATPYTGMETEIWFGEKGPTYGHWTLEETAEGTHVEWGFSMDMPFIARFMGVFITKGLETDFEKGLASLKQYVEANKQPDIAINQTTVNAMDYYGIVEEIKMEELDSTFFATHYMEIGTYLGEDAANMTGAPFAIYHEWNEDAGTAKVEVALAVASEKPSTDRIVKGTTYAGKVVKADYYGDYEGSGEAHYAIDSYLKANNLTITGNPWEVYVTDPSTEPDQSKWLTEIYYPIGENQAVADSISE